MGELKLEVKNTCFSVILCQANGFITILLKTGLKELMVCIFEPSVSSHFEQLLDFKKKKIYPALVA